MTDREIFDAALASTDPAQRSACLDQACGGDSARRQRIEALLEMHGQLGSFLESPAPAADLTLDYPPSVEDPSTVIGPYKLLQKIGEGGMGTVYMAQQTEPVKRLVALKIIKPGMDSRQVIARFEAERQALAVMDHPNIARVFDGGTTNSGRLYFVMELVKGMPLTAYCDEQRLGPRERLALFIPVCQALQHAHQKGIIHRDIKPSNVLVALYDGKPVPKVIDFGVAKAAGQPLTEHTLVTAFGMLVGTLEYMSPEQAELNQIDVDTRSDIYSLGVLLYELLTGTTPLEQKRLKQAAMLEALRLIREEEPPRPSTRLSTAERLPSIAASRGMEPKKLSGLVRGELDWIVMKCLEKDRDRRYQTATGLAADVQNYLADEAVAACPPSVGYRLRTFLRRNKRLVLAASLVLLTLVGGIIGTTWGLLRAERSRKLAEASEQKALKERATALAQRDAKEKALAAEIKARAAEKQARNQAISALQAMSDDIVENQMARAAYLTEENKEFLRKIINYYDSFAALTADDRESRTIRAEGYARVGLMRFHLGEMKEAEAAYVRALALFKQLTAAFSTQSEFRQYLATSHINLAQLLEYTSRPREAEKSYRAALALRKQLTVDFPTRPEFREALAVSHNNLGHLLRATGRVEEAEKAYRDALALQKHLAADFPTRLAYRLDLAVNLSNLGNLLRTTHRLKEAEKSYRDALALHKQLAADSPTRADLRRYLATTENNFGLLLRATSRLKEAEQAYRDSLALQKQLAADFPTQPEYRQDLVRTLNNLCTLLQDTTRLKEAEKAYVDALAVQKQLVADLPTRTDIRHGLARTHNNIGTFLEKMRRFSEAEKAYADGLAIYKPLAAAFPNQPDLRHEVAVALGNLGHLSNERGDFQPAKTYLEEALSHHQAALEANPQSPIYRAVFRRNLICLVHARAGSHDQAAAVQAAEMLRDLGWDPTGNAYDAGCALALCIPIVQKDDKTDVAKRRAAVQFYGDQAMTMLRVAVDKGYKDADQMKKDTDLDVLHERADFKSLIGAMDAKKN